MRSLLLLLPLLAGCARAGFQPQARSDLRDLPPGLDGARDLPPRRDGARDLPPGRDGARDLARDRDGPRSDGLSGDLGSPDQPRPLEGSPADLAIGYRKLTSTVAGAPGAIIRYHGLVRTTNAFIEWGGEASGNPYSNAGAIFGL